MAHFVRQCQALKVSFSAETRCELMSFRLVIVVSSNPIIFINVHPLQQQPARLIMRIDKVEWISAHNYDKPK